MRTIHAALDLGINLIDTAPAYGFGHSEEVVGRAIAEYGGRDRVVISTKGGLERRGDKLFRNSRRDVIRTEVENSLARLRTDYIDLYFVHWPDLDTPYEETAAALGALQKAGKIRGVAVSNYSIAAMERFHAITPLSAAQPPLNVFEREALRDIIPWCRERGIGTLTYGALCRGLLTGTIDESTKFDGDDLRKVDPKLVAPRVSQYTAAVRELEAYARQRYQRGIIPLAIRWTIDQPGVSVALWGARHPSELSPVIDVMGWHLDDEALSAIDRMLSSTIRDPVGPEFMAPPERASGADAKIPAAPI
ncbi:putative aldo/keto reductase [Sandaracinus amylolyticus]|uniref:Putative aldo/keto reductase n=1 Tax=Sandaracinus amylolyticus TaxID=927083 RepID=A0A0F6YMZ8_9BACT|nr:putative aldo/keto reductase [Sandaracinus amylolyticus]